MRSRRRWIVMLPLAILLLTASWVVPAAPAETDQVATEDGAEREVVLYYFHGTRRCKTCLSIEAYTQETLSKNFESELAAGALQWKVLNTDEPENEHFAEDFSLVSSSLVLVEMDGSDVVRHDVLQDAWTLVRDEREFKQYIRRSVQRYLK
jgi:hypothetical protein